jgi:hypothetical protein
MHFAVVLGVFSNLIDIVMKAMRSDDLFKSKVID